MNEQDNIARLEIELDEALCGEAWAIVIAPGKPCACDIELTRDSDRNRV